MKSHSKLFALGLMVAAAPAFAQSDVDLSTIVSDSVGYINIGPGIVLIEGDGVQPNRLCSIDVTESYITGVSNGEFPASGASYKCFALNESGNGALSGLLDDSVGYFQVREGVFIVEGDSSANVCSFTTTPAFWSSFENGGSLDQAVDVPKAVCFPLENLEG